MYCIRCLSCAIKHYTGLQSQPKGLIMLSFQMLPQWRLTILDKRHRTQIQELVLTNDRILEYAVSISHSVQGTLISLVTIIGHSGYGMGPGTIDVDLLLWDGTEQPTVSKAIAMSIIDPAPYVDSRSLSTWQEQIADALRQSDELRWDAELDINEIPSI